MNKTKFYLWVTWKNGLKERYTFNSREKCENEITVLKRIYGDYMVHTEIKEVVDE